MGRISSSQWIAALWAVVTSCAVGCGPVVSQRFDQSAIARPLNVQPTWAYGGEEDFEPESEPAFASERLQQTRFFPVPARPVFGHIYEPVVRPTDMPANSRDRREFPESEEVPPPTPSQVSPGDSPNAPAEAVPTPKSDTDQGFAKRFEAETEAAEVRLLISSPELSAAEPRDQGWQARRKQ